MNPFRSHQERLETMFPRASKSFLEANPPLSPTESIKTPNTPIVGSGKGIRGRMNKTEAEYALILEAMKRKGEILRWEYEGITLRFAGVKYTPDFVVFGWTGDGTAQYGGFGYTGIKFIEVKGAFTGGKFERAIERFRHARTYWPEFTFEMHQKTKSGWKQIL